MRIALASEIYSSSAILVAVKKQQGFADWRIESRNETQTVLSFSSSLRGESDEQCEQRLRRQLDDEQIRECLEKDFGFVRDMLVQTALGPIIGQQEA